MADDVERTEPPTARRRSEARREGQVAVSAEILTVVNLLAVSLTLLFVGASALPRSIALFHHLWVPRAEIDVAVAGDLFRKAFGVGAMLVAPVLLAALLSAVLATLAQTRGNLATGKLKFKWGNLNPQKGLRRIVREQAPVELVKSLAKMAIVGGAVWFAVGNNLEDYLGLSALTLFHVIGFQLGLVLKAFIAGSLALILVAAADYAVVYFRTEKSLKMSKSEVKDEQRQMEGDPMVRSRLRSLQLERARSRMMAAVETADVVVTNPEHFAVALLYSRSEMNAPKVVAKGRNLLAQRIRETATAAGVPILPNPPLARALYRSVKIGQSIPERLYQAVAEVLGHVYRLDRAKARQW